MLRIKSNAKINLTLNVTGKRSDGYHNIKSVMQSVSLHDVLVFSENTGAGLTLSCSDPSIPCDERNIINKAAGEFYRYTGLKHGNIHIHTEKNIPAEAGLGGGSANAAAALLGLNILAGNPCTPDELLKIGARTGADVPFCLTGGTCLCEGTGVLITPLPDLPECRIVIYKCGSGISTREAYKKIDERETAQSYDFDVKAFVSDLKTITGVCSNIFGEYAGIPEIQLVKERFLSGGALCAGMSGSGSAVYGIWGKNAELPGYAYENGYIICSPEKQGLVLINN